MKQLKGKLISVGEPWLSCKDPYKPGYIRLRLKASFLSARDCSAEEASTPGAHLQYTDQEHVTAIQQRACRAHKCKVTN